MTTSETPALMFINVKIILPNPAWLQNFLETSEYFDAFYDYN